MKTMEYIINHPYIIACIALSAYFIIVSGLALKIVLADAVKRKEKQLSNATSLTRERIAVMVMQAQIASADPKEMRKESEWLAEPERIASWAVKYADALIIELNKTNQE